MVSLQLIRTWTVALLGGFFACSAAIAEDDTMIDPPDRVARLSFIEGAVSLQPADAPDWIDAAINRPLTSSDRIWADSGARAELQIGTVTLRLDENTGFAFTTLDDEVMQIQLTDGAMTLHVRSLDANETLQIDTSNATVSIRQPGEYAIATEANGERTTVKTRSGEAEATGADGHGYIVRDGEQGVFSGTEQLSSILTQVAPRGAFEAWAYTRENVQTQSVATHYVSPAVVGYQDLDRNGTWAYEPEYGNVWQPTTYVFEDWAPYRYGRWVWMTPWGWTWIDDAPWGFAPFHYGRWTYLRERWCWVPGPMHRRPTYAPALVAWVGPPNFATDFTNVGWFPLGPRETYMPGRRTSWRYFQAVNSTNAAFTDSTQLTNAYNGRGRPNDYRNRAAPHAVTVIDREGFVGARRAGAKEIDGNDLRRWQNRATPPPIEPGRESRLGAQTSQRLPPQQHLQVSQSQRVARQPLAHPPRVQRPATTQPTVRTQPSPPAAPLPANRSSSSARAQAGNGFARHDRAQPPNDSAQAAARPTQLSNARELPRRNNAMPTAQAPARAQPPRLVQKQQSRPEPSHPRRARTVEQPPQRNSNNRTMAPSARGQEHATPGQRSASARNAESTTPASTRRNDRY